jgi:hypothetical protein
MFDEKEITRLIDGYIDGQLDAEDTRKLVALLQESHDLKDRLALSSIVERVLRVTKLPPLSGEQVMGTLRDKGLVQAREEDETLKRKWVLFGSRKQPVDRQMMQGGRKLWEGSRPSGQQSSGPAVVMTVVICLLAAAGAWWFFPGLHPGEREAKPPRQVSVVEPERRQGSRTEPERAKESVKVPKTGAESSRSPVVESNMLVSVAGVDTIVAPQEHKDVVVALPDLPPPVGDGSDEPGFVPPPSDGSKAVSSRDASARNPLVQNVVTAGMHVTMPRELPQAPLLFVKIKTDNPRQLPATPDDLSSLLREIQDRMRISYRMEIKALGEIDPDPEKNPILYVTGHYHFIYTPAERAKLRKFMLAGGMLVFDAGLGSKPFYDSARRELRMIFPETMVQRLSLDHPLFHSYYDLARVRYCSGVREKGYKGDEPWFEGVTVNCRSLAVISRWGMAIGWEGRAKDSYPAYQSEDAIELGINLFSYATAVRAWVKQSANATTFVDRDSSSADKLFIGQVIYDGEWKTRHSALSILLQTFNQRTEVPVKFGIKDIRLTDQQIFNAPLLYVTGHEGFRLSNDEVQQLRKYLQSGGFLFAEACCGRKGFDRAFRAEMKKVITESMMVSLPRQNDVYSLPNKVGNVSVTPSLANLIGASIVIPRLEGIEINGHYGVIYSPYGIAGSWEMSQSPYAFGYNDAEALKLGQNVLMYAVTH